MKIEHNINVINGGERHLIGKLCFPDLGDKVCPTSVIVIPHGGSKYHLEGMNCAGIITEIGNRLSHLAIVTREQNTIMVQLDGAIEKLRGSGTVWIDCKSKMLFSA